MTKAEAIEAARKTLRAAWESQARYSQEPGVRATAEQHAAWAVRNMLDALALPDAPAPADPPAVLAGIDRDEHGAHTGRWSSDAPAPAPSERERVPLWLPSDALSSAETFLRTEAEEGRQWPGMKSHARSLARHIVRMFDHPPTDAAAADAVRDAWDEEMRHVLACMTGDAEVTGNEPPWFGDLWRRFDTAKGDAAAAERAEIVAMLDDVLRDRETQHGMDIVAVALRAVRTIIAARGPGPVWTEERVKKLAEAVRDKAADLCCFPISGTRGSLAREVDAIDLDAIIARVRAGA